MRPHHTLCLAALRGTLVPVGLPVWHAYSADALVTIDLSFGMDMISRRLDAARQQIQPGLSGHNPSRASRG